MISRIPRALVLALATSLPLVLAGACVSTRPNHDTALIPTDEDDPRAAGAAEVPDEAPEPVAEVARTRTGTIPRAELDSWLDAGPPGFLRGVRVHADVGKDGAGQHYRGWVIDSFWPGDARFAAVDLRPGDVVRLVNGKALVRPEHLQAVWDGLREATTLTVEVTRPAKAGAPAESFVLEYKVVDTP